jgi:hypothetical protein
MRDPFDVRSVFTPLKGLRENRDGILRIDDGLLMDLKLIGSFIKE